MEEYKIIQEKPQEKIVKTKQENEDLFENTDKEIIMLEKMLSERKEAIKQKQKDDQEM